jgi:hypothetical protein
LAKPWLKTLPKFTVVAHHVQRIDNCVTKRNAAYRSIKKLKEVASGIFHFSPQTSRLIWTKSCWWTARLSSTVQFYLCPWWTMQATLGLSNLLIQVDLIENVHQGPLWLRPHSSQFAKTDTNPQAVLRRNSDTSALTPFRPFAFDYNKRHFGSTWSRQGAPRGKNNP